LETFRLPSSNAVEEDDDDDDDEEEEEDLDELDDDAARLSRRSSTSKTSTTTTFDDDFDDDSRRSLKRKKDSIRNFKDDVAEKKTSISTRPNRGRLRIYLRKSFPLSRRVHAAQVIGFTLIESHMLDLAPRFNKPRGHSRKQWAARRPAWHHPRHRPRSLAEQIEAEAKIRTEEVPTSRAPRPSATRTAGAGATLRAAGGGDGRAFSRLQGLQLPAAHVSRAGHEA